MWIPAYINDVPVTTIPKSTFENEASLVKVVVPDTVTSIGLGAFKGCDAIEDITLPFVGASADATCYDAVFGYIFGYTKSNTLSYGIPAAAFNNCDFIETINLPDTVESIGDCAFQNCNATINYFSTEE